ncbi:hypothetical protein D3C72_1743860 [compost metagenome]
MSLFYQLRALLCLAQQSKALFGIAEKGIQQFRILVLHDLAQRAQRVQVQMFVSHLFAP